MARAEVETSSDSGKMRGAKVGNVPALASLSTTSMGNTTMSEEVKTVRIKFAEIFCVYGPNTKDYEGKHVVRAFFVVGYLILAEETPLAITDTLEEARAAIPLGLERKPRLDADDEAIIETWHQTPRIFQITGKVIMFQPKVRNEEDHT